MAIPFRAGLPRDRLRCWYFVVCLIVFACSGARVQRASESFRAHRDFESLEVLAAQLHAGMTETEVKALLGEPNYSPIEGQYYYSTSDRTALIDPANPDSRGTVTLVLSYHTRPDPHPQEDHLRIVEGLESFSLGPVGE